jgi:hypothetical protein
MERFSGEDLAMFHSASRMPGMLLAAIFVAGSASTAAQGTDSAVDESQFGILYVYHLSESGFAKGTGAIGLRRVKIYVDDAKPFSLPSGRHARLLLQPGIHRVYAKFSTFGLPGRQRGDHTIRVDAGNAYYLHYFERPEGIGVVQRFEMRDATEGAKGVALTKSVKEK